MDKIKFFIDFDGTITKTDVVDMILERFADPGWRAIEKEWSEGKMGSRECLTKQMNLLSGTGEALKKFLLKVEIDGKFISFLKTARDLSVPVFIVSDGFREVIEEILRKNFKQNPDLVSNIPIYSNRLIPRPGGFKVQFPEGMLCEHACANCKAKVIGSLTQAGDTVVFVGDGLSDRFAVGVADLTFAKGKLLKFCEENGIQHKKYSNFREIEKWMAHHCAIRSNHRRIKYAAV